MGGTIILGLLCLIIWKIVIDFYDKREYEKFEREKHLAQWGKVSFIRLMTLIKQSFN